MASKNIVVFCDDENQLSGGTNRVQTCLLRQETGILLTMRERS
ncbi:hypothetical protein RDI58_024874 [Solanum bulbocastanum]|uniref:Uncharacterized protein n=1 Tax=Solanum bulbocastanum TaxID=147425 RepID=A0AAN8T420_SOLBU